MYENIRCCVQVSGTDAPTLDTVQCTSLSDISDRFTSTQLNPSKTKINVDYTVLIFSVLFFFYIQIARQ